MGLQRVGHDWTTFTVSKTLIGGIYAMDRGALCLRLHLQELLTSASVSFLFLQQG